MHIYGISKDRTDHPIFRAAKETETQRTHFWTQWEERGQDDLREQHIESYTLLCVKEIASGSSMRDAGTQSQCSVAAWRMGWGGSGRGPWMPMADSC